MIDFSGLDEASLKRRFKMLALELHPDRNPYASAESFASLSSEYKRRLSELQAQRDHARLDALWQLWAGATACASLATACASVVVPTAVVVGLTTQEHVNTLNAEHSAATQAVRKAEDAMNAATSALEMAQIKASSCAKELVSAEAAAARATAEEAQATVRFERAKRASQIVPDELLLKSVNAYHEERSALAARRRAEDATTRRHDAVREVDHSKTAHDRSLREAKARLATCTTALKEARAEKEKWEAEVQAWRAGEEKAKKATSALSEVGVLATYVLHFLLRGIFGPSREAKSAGPPMSQTAQALRSSASGSLVSTMGPRDAPRCTYIVQGSEPAQRREIFSLRLGSWCLRCEV